MYVSVFTTYAFFHQHIKSTILTLEQRGGSFASAQSQIMQLLDLKKYFLICFLGGK